MSQEKQIGLPSNFEKLSTLLKKKVLLSMTLDYPAEVKYLPLSKLWNYDSILSEKILDESGGFNPKKIDKVVKKYLAELN
jgi:hypothetical protein